MKSLTLAVSGVYLTLAVLYGLKLLDYTVFTVVMTNLSSAALAFALSLKTEEDKI